MMTVEEFIAHDFPEAQVELVRGEPRMTPFPGGAHGVVCGNLLAKLMPHVSAQRLGRVFADGVGYELVALPHTVRGPDVSFVRAERLPASGVGPGLLRMAPDLAVEVLSPSETAALLEEKLNDYVMAGTSLIWVVDPGASHGDGRVGIRASSLAPRWRHARRWGHRARISYVRSATCSMASPTPLESATEVIMRTLATDEHARRVGDGRRLWRGLHRSERRRHDRGRLDVQRRQPSIRSCRRRAARTP